MLGAAQLSVLTLCCANRSRWEADNRSVAGTKVHSGIFFRHTLRLPVRPRFCPVLQMVFSSSCTVYGNPEKVPINEEHPLKAVSPYGRTKLIIEDIFRDVAAAEPEWRTILLRYFNPVGAHPSGEGPFESFHPCLYASNSAERIANSYTSGLLKCMLGILGADALGRHRHGL